MQRQYATTPLALLSCALLPTAFVCRYLPCNCILSLFLLSFSKKSKLPTHHHHHHRKSSEAPLLVHAGSTQKVSVRDKCAIFEEAITFECTLFQHTKKKSFEEKFLDCTLKEFLGKKTEELSKTKLDLGMFGVAGSYQFQSIPFKTKRKDTPPPTLLVSVKSTWVRVGGKKLVKDGKAKDKEHALELDGEQYALETDMNASAADSTSVGGGGGGGGDDTDDESGSEAPRSDASPKSEQSVLSELKASDPPEKQLKKLRKSTKKLEKENRRLREELEHAKDKSRERLRQMNSLKKEIAALKKCVGGEFAWFKS